MGQVLCKPERGHCDKIRSFRVSHNLHGSEKEDIGYNFKKKKQSNMERKIGFRHLLFKIFLDSLSQ